jgi:hypothetical protein
MRDTELYRHLLGLLEPWTGEWVELNVTARRVDVWASHHAGVTWSCPEGDYTGPILDHAEERTWAIKESLRELWAHPTAQEAEGFWRRWCWRAAHSRLAPVRAVAWLIKRHWTNIVTCFRHKLTHAVSEGLNSKIQTIKKMAYGFRNKEHFKTAICFHCGGLDLYPR